MPKAFTDAEKQWIYERLVDQGSRLFSSQGLKKTSIEELAQSAGISKAAFYIFYPSKEALFMDVVERVEQHYRQEVLAMIDQPGPSPRARLVRLLQKAFTVWKTMPILQFFTRSEYDLIARRVPPEKIEEHLISDMQFFEKLVARCRKAGIPFKARPDEISGLMYALFFTVLHENDLGPGSLTPAIEKMIELVAAYCLGEVTLSPPLLTEAAQETNHERSD